MASSSSSLNWLYDVFVSFRGEDVRVNFLSHFFKELDLKLITAFKDYEIEKSHSLSPELKNAIRSSRIAVVVFSKNYASSSWCLKELLEIMNREDKIIIPIFYGVDPSHVRKQIGEFGDIFKKTCKNNTEEEKDQWKKALTDVANMVGFDSANWNNEAKMIEEIAKDVLGKLLPTSSKDFENYVGMEDHMAKMSELLQLESEEVMMVGILGSSGIGKTTIARALFNQFSRQFQVSKFIDRTFVSKSKEPYSGANPVDHNMKLHLQENFLSEILRMKDIKIDHLDALGGRLQHQKVLLIIDDLDDLMVLNVLADKTQWFGSGSRIIVVTNDKHFLRAHGIVHIYEVSFPTEVQAIQMLCQYAFGKNNAPEGFKKLVVEVARHAGSLPMGLSVLGSCLKRRDKMYWEEMLPMLQDGKVDDIEKILRISYDGLRREDQAIFRHIACLFNHHEEKTIKLLLADSNITIALCHLVDKSLIHVRQGYVVMHRSLEEMGRKIVRIQSIDKLGEREFLVDSKDICYVLSKSIGTEKILGISLDLSEIHELQIHKSSFKGMCKLRFLKVYSKIYTHLPESFDYWPPELKLLSWKRYPMSCMPYGFRPDNLVKLEMQESKLKKLWEGVESLPCLKEMNLRSSHNLQKIPDLSMAINLEILDLSYCFSLVELPSSIRNLNKLLALRMLYCNNLVTLPTGFNLKSLCILNFSTCRKLRTFPKFSANITHLVLDETNIDEFPSNFRLENLSALFISKIKSDGKQWDGKQWQGVKPLTPFMAMLSPTLTRLRLVNIPNLVELPSSFQNLNQLKDLYIGSCRNLETLPTGINLQSVISLNLNGCSRLRSFPEISTNISKLNLEETGIEEVPCRIENFSNLFLLYMRGCRRLKCVSLHISKLKRLTEVEFSDCGELTRVDLSGNSSEMEMEADNIDTVPEEASSSLSDGYFSIPRFDFSDCFKLDKEALLQQQSINFDYMRLPGEEVPSYFTYRTTGISPLLDVPLSQPFFRFRVCAVVNAPYGVDIDVNCQFKGKNGNSFDSIVQLPNLVVKGSHQLLIFDCSINLNEDIAQLKYDLVDMEIHVSAGPPVWKLMFSIRAWGIRLLEHCSSPENRLCYRKTFPRNENALLLRYSNDSIVRNLRTRKTDLYFTHRATGSSLTNIPLPPTSPSHPFFRFKAFLRFDCKSSGQFSDFDIQVSCRFRDRFGNHFDSPYRPYKFCRCENGTNSAVLECLFPLNEDNASLAQLKYDHVDIHFQLRSRGDSTVRLMLCGIRFFVDCSSPENRIGNPKALQHVFETKSSEDSNDSDKGSENDEFEECGESEMDEFEECGESEMDEFEECGESEMDEFEECGESEMYEFEECETEIMV